MSADENRKIALRWLEAFNASDVDALAKWWRESNARLPGLRYELTALTASEERVFVEYVRHAPDQPPMPVAEVFDVRGAKIVASRVYHG